MNEKYKYLSKNVLLFSISSFLPKVLSFVMIPVYTSVLTPGDYGISELIATTVALLLPIFTCDIQDAVMRFAFDRAYTQSAVFSTALRIVGKGILLIAVGCLGLCLLQVPGLETEYIVFVFWQYAIQALGNSCNLFCRGIEQVKVLTMASLLQSVLFAGLNMLLLFVWPLGFTGYMLSGTISATLALIYMIIKAKLYRYIDFDRYPELQRQMISFSFPLIFSVLAWWVNNASDRYIVTWMAGVSVSGLYAVASKIPNILVAFEGVFYQAWSISAVKEFDSEDKDGFIGRMYTMTNAAMVLLCSAIMMGNIPLASVLYSAEFFSAWIYVPPLLIAIVFNCLSLFIGSIYTTVKKTKILSYTTISGAVVNTVLNFILIYFFGAYGAAVATMISFIVVAFGRLYFLNRFLHMRVRYRRDVVGYILLILQAAVAYCGNSLILLQSAVFISLVAIYYHELYLIIHKVFLRFH